MPGNVKCRAMADRRVSVVAETGVLGTAGRGSEQHIGEELSAVSVESCTTLITKPIATTCMATSVEMPNRLAAMGISSSEPPATPETPQPPGRRRCIAAARSESRRRCPGYGRRRG